MKAAKKEITLDSKLAAIGFRIYFSGPGLAVDQVDFLEEVDLEETLIRAAYEARKDFRLLSILMTWMSVHGEYVIVEKFAKKRQAFEKVLGVNPVLDLMAAQAVTSGNAKWKKQVHANSKKPKIPLDPELLESSIQYQGANEGLKRLGLLVPKKLLRIREDDVLTAAELAKTNVQFRNRLVYGASWRADIISAIDAGVKNPSQASRLLGCSYEPAYRVYRDYRVAQAITAKTAE